MAKEDIKQMQRDKMMAETCEKIKKFSEPEVLEPTKNPFILADRWLLEHSVLWCIWTLYAQTFVYPFKWLILGFYTISFLCYGVHW